MKKEHIIVSFIKATVMVLMLCTPVMIEAQEYENTPVTVSKEKVRIDGQICYSHIVLEKQTLFSISKAYGVEIEDIYKYNPTVKENGLKKNSIILIPAVESEEKNAEPETETEVAAKDEVETAVKEKARNNPSEKMKTHTVKWFEDIDGIAAKYGISVEALMKANNLDSRKLAKRQKLIIPSPDEYQDENGMGSSTEPSSESDTTFTADSVAVKDTIADEEGKLFPGLLFPKKKVDVSLLLPLNATGTSSSRQNMDFYSGVLLATYDLADEGISTNLNVYDVANGNLPTTEERIMNSDIIIGPVASGDISRVFDMAPEVKALISPLDPRAGDLITGRHNMIHAPTPHSAQYEDLVSWIKEDMKPGERCLVITEKGARQTDAITDMMSAIDSCGISYSPLSYSILEGRNVTASLEYLMAENATNRVYIASESEAFVNDVVRNLNLMIHKKYDVVLYAPSKIRSFETIEVDNFHNAHMHVSAGYYINYDDAMVKDFLLKYRALFNTEPTQFAFQGYDIAKFFISLCSRYGNRWMEKLDDQTMEMLQSTFSFIKTEDGGYINNGVRRIVYEDEWRVTNAR